MKMTERDKFYIVLGKKHEDRSIILTDKDNTEDYYELSFDGKKALPV